MSVENISQTVSDLFEDYAKANGWGATKGKLSQSKIDFFSGAAAAFVAMASAAEAVGDDAAKAELAVNQIGADIWEQLTAMLNERETIDN